MSWTLLFCVVVTLGFALAAALSRRSELRQMESTVKEREKARELGGDEAQLQHPIVDLSRCLGCGTCVQVCPEDGVLELVHGQASVVNGARCVGVAACERECPVGAITVTLSNLDERHDIPVLDESLEAVGSPGLFLAGEVTAHALIKTAIEHGTAVGAEIARRIEEDPGMDDERVLDLLIVGAGPAGLACALEAHEQGLRALTIEQESELGGTVAKYPRRKLVMTLPVDLPGHGRMRERSYSKEELMELWTEVVDKNSLPIRHGEVFEGVERDPVSGHYVVRTKRRRYRARFVCIAIGRRGVPRRLGIPGEELTKVAYSLVDAASYQGRKILVVGGGDSAIEAAMGLAEQPGNEVTISYRKADFFRLRAKNQDRIQQCIAEGIVTPIFHSDLLAIHDGHVELGVTDEVGGGQAIHTIENDDVFVMAGGIPPFKLLEESGVSFDPELRRGDLAAASPAERGTGLVEALTLGLGLALLCLGFAIWNIDYYGQPIAIRPELPKHAWLRPSQGIGLWLGIASSVLILVNLVYLLRRSPDFPLRWGSLQLWMTSHVGTGVLALLTALLHGAMAPGNTPGGHAFWGLLALAATGAVGRYVYAYIPRATNGRELELSEVRARLGRISEAWDQGQRRFQQRAREMLHAHIERSQWQSSFLGRFLAVMRSPFRLRALIADIKREAASEDVSEDQQREVIALVRRAHGTALMAAHYEDLRGLLASWRFMHRWVSLLMVMLVIVHVANALRYGTIFEGAAGHAFRPPAVEVRAPAVPGATDAERPDRVEAPSGTSPEADATDGSGIDRKEGNGASTSGTDEGGGR